MNALSKYILSKFNSWKGRPTFSRGICYPILKIALFYIRDQSEVNLLEHTFLQLDVSCGQEDRAGKKGLKNKCGSGLY